jgi:hypothetical protein
VNLRPGLSLPKYLEENYWWAYLHPQAVHVFEREWLVNLILWGNFSRLRDVALQEFQPSSDKVLQVACVNGNFTQKLAELLPQTHIDPVDVAPIQLQNLAKKITPFSNVFLHHRSSVDLQLPTSSYDSVIILSPAQMPQEVSLALLFVTPLKGSQQASGV